MKAFKKNYFSVGLERKMAVSSSFFFGGLNEKEFTRCLFLNYIVGKKILVSLEVRVRVST